MLQEADMGLTEMAFGGQNARYKDDKNLLVRFLKIPMQNMAKTKEEGRPIWEDVDHVQIMVPGNKDSIVVKPVDRLVEDRFAEAYAAYKARQTEDYVDGTRLTEWPGVTRAQAEELRFFNILTVEQLANVADSNAGQIMGFQMLKSRAQAYLENADDNALKQALKDQKDENALLQEQMKEMATRLAALESSEGGEKPRRGRRKTAEE